MSTYIGSRGYTILKDYIDVKELRVIRDELTVRPKIHNAPVQPPAFKIYTENANKIYVPRYYGIEMYGEPDEIRMIIKQ